MDALAAAEAQRERQRIGDAFGCGGGEAFGHVGHWSSIGDWREQRKNEIIRRSPRRTAGIDPLLSFKIVYERAENSRKLPLAERDGCAATDRSESGLRTRQSTRSYPTFQVRSSADWDANNKHCDKGYEW